MRRAGRPSSAATLTPMLMVSALVDEEVPRCSEGSCWPWTAHRTPTRLRNWPRSSPRLPATRTGPTELEPREDARQLVEQCAKELAGIGVNATTDIGRAPGGRVARTLVDAADEHRAGLIVM